jgi:apolipoprotein N-acyltransferase
MDRIPALVGDITPGTSFTLSDIAGARLGALICFEATRPDIARRFRSEGASGLVQISNELWFGPTSAARQMLAHAVFRAVENNIDLIRATNSGLSAQIDRYGAVHDETPMLETAVRSWKVLTADQARRDPVTFYTRYGDLFVIACAGFSLLFAIAALVPRKEIDE